MEKQNGYAPKATKNGVSGKPPLYSVETPYGFRLDLDFLKYVDDIEKGHTMKRVPGQRRSKAQRPSTLPRLLHLSGHSQRPSLWGSTGALAPRSQTADPRYGSRAYDVRSPASPGGCESVAEMEACIRAFDEQPLGEHVRPSLIRATSLPLTVLLRKGSGSTEDVLRASDSSSDRLSGQDVSGNLRRLTKALERVALLEEEVRVVPELKAQICVLQEERERLRIGLDPRPRLRDRDHKSLGNERCLLSRVEDVSNRSHGWRTSTDLDELLTVTSLQAKVAVLEQKLHQSGLELQRATALLREQRDEVQRRRDVTRPLTGNDWARAERVPVDQDEEDPENSPERAPAGPGATSTPGRLIPGEPFAINAVTATANRLDSGTRAEGSSKMVVQENNLRAARNGPESPVRDVVRVPCQEAPMEPTSEEEASPGGIDQAVAASHVRRIQGLLEQQWKCLCGGRTLGESRIPEHPDSQVNTLHEEIRSLVHTLSSFYNHGSSDGDASKGVPQCAVERIGEDRTSRNLHLPAVNNSFETTQDENSDWKSPPKDLSATRQQPVVHAPPDSGSIHGDPTNGDPMDQTAEREHRTHRGVVVTAKAAEKKTASTAEEPMEAEPHSEPNQEPRDRERVDGQFIEACHFVKDHMEDVENPGDEMRQTLVVLFQVWFRVAAEEGSLASQVAMYLREVRMATPSLLPFLVNMADDNGNTALHYSVSHAKYMIVSLLLDTDVCEVDLQNKAGYTAVMLASLTAPRDSGDMEVVHRLMELGDVNARASQGGQTALMLAARHGRALMVRLLLRCRADPNVQDHQGASALMGACERGHAQVVRLLLDRAECDTGLTDQRGRTALSVAQHGSHGDITGLLQTHRSQRGTSV